LETNDFLFVAGNINETVDIIDLTTNTVLQSVAPFAAFSGHACDPPAGTGGFVTITGLGGLLIQGHVLAAVSSDGAVDTAIVLGSPPTLTPTSTSTPIPTSTPSPTATPTSSPTPSQPYIVLIPDCGVPAQPQGPVTFNVIFINWPTNQSLTLLWEGAPELVWQAGQHNGSFSIAVTKILPYPASQVTYSVQAQSGSGQSDTDLFTVPCTLVPTSTPNPGATSTPAPEDLVILGAPVLISTRPIVAYQPVQFTVPITNAGDVDVSSQFFVDIYLDPNPSVVLTTTIPISESDGYSAVSQLAGHTGKVITITSPFGFTNNPPTHLVYGFVDSLEQINEIDETNNISLTPQPVIDVTPGTPPTATSTPGGSDEISGGALTLGNDLILQFRAQMMLIDDSTGSVVARTTSDTNGFYRFSSVSSPASTYTVAGCITIDGADWYGTRTGIVPPNLTAHVIMLKQPCP
ncbi:MAG: hypothetical protein GY796_15120, partial [Chloroflexi bacterium]|nr:hypothetical protein [Chloroflexota bacterium]